MLVRDRGDAGPQRGGGAGGGLRAGSGGKGRRSRRAAQGLDVAGQGLLGVERRQPQRPAHTRGEGAGRAGDRDRAGRSRQGQPERPPGDAAARGGRGRGRDNGALPGRQDDLGVRDRGEIAVIHLADRGGNGLSRGGADRDPRPAAQRARRLGGIAENDIPGLLPHSLIGVPGDGVGYANAQVSGLARGRRGRSGGVREDG